MIRNCSRAAGLVLALLPLVAAGCSDTAASKDVKEPASLAEAASRSLAQIDGTLAVPGLKAPVEIVRDQQGVPHIYAQNDDDLFFAQGYVMAQDRLWQLEMWRRWREGRLAEVFGPKAVDFDVRTRLMMFRGPWDDTEWTSYHKDAERLFTAWANGHNAYIQANADNLPIEFKLTGITPEPWTAKTLTLRWANLAIDSVRYHGIAEIQLALQAKKLGVKEANRRSAPDPWDDLTVPEGLDLNWFTDDLLAAARRGDGNPFAPDVLPSPEIVEPYRSLVPKVQAARLMPELQDMDGSNNWVVSGAHTVTGFPILSNDPHRTIEMPSLRYFVHLNAPGWNVIGGGEPPFVGVDAGNNENMAWGFTFAGTDMVDVVVEQTNPANPNETKFRDGWEPMKTIREEIRVKGKPAPRSVELKFSKHGPVFYEDPVNHLAFAAKSVNQEPGTAAFKGSLKLAQATSCEDFFDRAMYWKMPTHNLICGDNKGNIAFQVTGLTPDRDGWNGRLPVPGTGKYEWKGFRSDLPREYNPARGYIATANDQTQPKEFKGRPVFYNVSTDVDVSRIARIRQMLDSADCLRQEDRHRGHGTDAAGRVLAARRARRAALHRMDGSESRRGEGARDDCRVGSRAHGDHRAGCAVRALVDERCRPQSARRRGQRAAEADRRRAAAGDRTRDARLGRRLESVAVRTDQREQAAAYVHRRVQPAINRAPGWLQHGECDRRELPARHRSDEPRSDDGDECAGTIGSARKPVRRQPARASRGRCLLQPAVHAWRCGQGTGAHTEARAEVDATANCPLSSVSDRAGRSGD
ncbi:MAG: penicillin acylase family protein [Vicinamibacterales bacterium]